MIVTMEAIDVMIVTQKLSHTYTSLRCRLCTKMFVIGGQ
jgi:hypothetical protein